MTLSLYFRNFIKFNEIIFQSNRLNNPVIKKSAGIFEVFFNNWN